MSKSTASSPCKTPKKSKRSGSPVLMVVGKDHQNASGTSDDSHINNGVSSVNNNNNVNSNHGAVDMPNTNVAGSPSITVDATYAPASTAAEISNKQSLKHLNVNATPVMQPSNLSTPEPMESLNIAPSSSKSRQKKFHRCFKQVKSDEKVIDYYSCALVADILLQGYLYITENHFAFYSNVFGYITKVLIPISTVKEITKEKTAKIIPNAVGVFTKSDKHVFASLISRDTTYKLMQKVLKHNQQWTAQRNSILEKQQSDCVDEIESQNNPDESSAESGSGNDSAIEASSCTPSPVSSPGIDKLCVQTATSGENGSISSIGTPLSPAGPDALCGGEGPVTMTATAAVLSHQRTPKKSFKEAYNSHLNAMSEAGQKLTSAALSNSKSSSLMIIATILLVILFSSAIILLNRIHTLQEKMSQNGRPAIHDSEHFYEELLNWQNKLHSHSANEIHQFIDTNLQQIIRVRESLEALSLLFMGQGQNSDSHPHTTAYAEGIKSRKGEAYYKNENN